MTQNTDQQLGIDWLKTIAGALAAVSAAVLLSTLGAAGTIVGAALGSVVATVGGALYSQGLARSHERVARASQAARNKVWIARAEVSKASRGQGDGHTLGVDLAQAEVRLDEAQDGLDAVVSDHDDVTWRERFAMLRWRHILAAAAGLFVVTVLTITMFELVAGQTVSSITGGTNGGGGTTITHIGDRSHPSHKPSPTEQTSPTSQGTVGPEQSSGSSAAAPSPTTTGPPTNVPTTTAPTTTGPTTGPTAASNTPTTTPRAG